MLYIINHNKYLDYYKDGFMKYIPYGLLPKIKPKIIEDIVREDHVIGKIAGVNIKSIDFNSKNVLEEYIIGIKQLGIEGFQSLYIEEMEYIPENAIEYMEDTLNLKISPDKDVGILHIPLVIKEIYKLLDDELQDKEVLIISRDKEVSKNIIKTIGKDIKFITNLGCNPEDMEEVYNYVYEEIGLSIFHSSDINKILGRYNIVVNLVEDFNLELSKIRRNVIFFDFSSINGLKSKVSNNKKTFYRIRDFGFKLKDMNIKESRWLDDCVDSELYGKLNGRSYGKVKLLYIGRDCYSINDYVNTFIKLKGKL